MKAAILSVIFFTPVCTFAADDSSAFLPELSRVVNTVDAPLSETDIVGNFTNITTEVTSSKFYGGALYNYGRGAEINSITGTFSGNTNICNIRSNSRGGAVYNAYNSKIGVINGDFINNTSKATGELSANAGAVYNSDGAIINQINGNFIGNSAVHEGSNYTFGGAIYNTSGEAVIGEINGNFINNSAISATSKAAGGAIINYNGTVTVKDGSFINNRVITPSDVRYGGAISVEGAANVNIISDKKDVIFSNNFTASKDNKDGTYENKVSNAITLNTSSSVLNLNAGEHSIIFNDRIDSRGGNNKQTININMTGTWDRSVSDKATGNKLSTDAPTGGTIVLNEDMTGYKGNVNFYNGVIKLGENGKFFDVNNFNVEKGTLVTANGVIETTSLGNLTISDTLNLYMDADLKAGIADTIFSKNIMNEKGKINIKGINLLSEPDSASASIKLADDSLINAVVYDGKDYLENKIFRYNVNYDSETGILNLNRFAGNSYRSYNPAVLAAPVAAQVGGYLTQLNTYDIAFTNVDMYMLMSRNERTALKLRNKIAAANDGAFSPLVSKYEEKGVWFKPFTSFEDVPLKNGPKVSNVSYGMFAGADSELTDIGKGWEGMGSVYVGYNGSHQTYEGIGIYQNGGTLGLTGVAYKGSFFTALTANVGANQAEASTMYGRDDFTMLMAGVASKSGYNWELMDGKFIIQPNYQMSYTYVNTFGFTNAGGVRVDSDPLSAIQIAPGIKFIGNLKNGWQPYLGVTMVWNVIDKTKFQANDVSLPEMSIKPFVVYGAGVQKNVGEKFTGFGQVFFRNGGRNGVGFLLGFRWALGKA